MGRTTTIPSPFARCGHSLNTATTFYHILIATILICFVDFIG